MFDEKAYGYLRSEFIDVKFRFSKWRLVSSKNLVFLSCNPVALFLDITLKLIEVHLLRLFYDSFEYRIQIDLLEKN